VVMGDFLLPRPRKVYNMLSARSGFCSSAEINKLVTYCGGAESSRTPGASVSKGQCFPEDCVMTGLDIVR